MENNNSMPHEVSIAKKLSVAKGKYAYTWAEMLENGLKEIPMMVPPILPRTGLVAFAGSSDTGKSALLRQLACAIATGQTEFLGFKLTLRYQKALYISTEDDYAAMSALLARREGAETDSSGKANLRIIFNTSDLLEKIEEQLREDPVDCVFIDAYSDIFDGDINQVSKVRSHLQDFSNMSQRHKCLFVFLHHTGKRTESLEPSKNNLLGSQGFEGKMRMVAELRRDPQKPDIRHLCIVKGNYVAEEYKNASFVLQFNPETLLFHNIEQRVEFSKLVKVNSNVGDKWKESEKLILEFKDWPSRKIVSKLEELGLPGKHSFVSEVIKKDKLSKEAIKQLDELFADQTADNQLDRAKNGAEPTNDIPKDGDSNGTYYGMFLDNPFDD